MLIWKEIQVPCFTSAQWTMLQEKPSATTTMGNAQRPSVTRTPWAMLQDISMTTVMGHMMSIRPSTTTKPIGPCSKTSSITTAMGNSQRPILLLRYHYVMLKDLIRNNVLLKYSHTALRSLFELQRPHRQYREDVHGCEEIVEYIH